MQLFSPNEIFLVVVVVELRLQISTQKNRRDLVNHTMFILKCFVHILITDIIQFNYHIIVSISILIIG